MKYFALMLALLATLMFSGIMFGCQEEGPAEEAGEQVDDAMDEAGDALDDLTDG